MLRTHQGRVVRGPTQADVIAAIANEPVICICLTKTPGVLPFEGGKATARPTEGLFNNIGALAWHEGGSGM